MSASAVGKIAVSALVSDTARAWLTTIRDEWSASLVERIGELERENGRLEAIGAAKAETIAELRRRAEAAEAALARQRVEEAVAPAALEDARLAPGSPHPARGCACAWSAGGGGNRPAPLLSAAHVLA